MHKHFLEVQQTQLGDTRRSKEPEMSEEDQWAVRRRELHLDCEAQEKKVWALEKGIVDEQEHRSDVEQAIFAEVEQSNSLKDFISKMNEEVRNSQRRCATLRSDLAEKEDSLNVEEHRINELQQELIGAREAKALLADQVQTSKHNWSMLRARLQRELNAVQAEVRLLQEAVDANTLEASSLQARTAAARDLAHATRAANMHRTLGLINHIDGAKTNLVDVSREKKDFTASLCTEREKWLSVGQPRCRRLERKVLDDGIWLGSRLEHTSHKDIELIAGIQVEQES